MFKFTIGLKVLKEKKNLKVFKKILLADMLTWSSDNLIIGINRLPYNWYFEEPFLPVTEVLIYDIEP